MRSTIDIDEKLMKEAQELTRGRTKREVVDLALRELVRRKRIERMKERIGTDRVTLTLRELEELRRGG